MKMPFDIIVFVLAMLTEFKELKGFQILNVIQNSPDSISFDANIDAIHSKNLWNIDDEAHLMLPQTSGETATVIGKVTYVKNYQSFPTDTENIYIYGAVPPVEHISLVSGTFSMAFYNNTITANIQYPGNTQYELRPLRYERNDSDLTKSPNYILSKINMFEKYYSKQVKETEARNRVIQSQSLRFQSQPAKFKNIELQETAYLKVLMMYTKQAVTVAGGENNLLSAISLAIGNFNIALQNSNVDISVSYVAQRIIEYDTFVESNDFEVILSQMGSSISTSQRKALSCHAVHLVVSKVNLCGIDYYLFNGMTNGYSVGSYDCIGGYATTAHEVGHNIGLAHDLSVSDSKTFNLTNHGYCWDVPGPTSCYRTIMAYESCVTPLGRTNCQQSLVFSNPYLAYENVPIGTVPQCNNAQQLRNNINNFMGQFSLIFPTNTPTKIPITLPPVFPTYISTPVSVSRLDNFGLENGLIIGGTVGGAVFLLVVLICIGIFFCRSKKRNLISLN